MGSTHMLLSSHYLHNFQPACKEGYSCETALLIVYNDIVTTIGNVAMLLAYCETF